MRPPLFIPAEVEASDEVGYCRPPRATRFRPGRSGNPLGRPNRLRALGVMMARALGEKVEAKEGGRIRRITKLEAAVTQLANRAASGDQRATMLAFSLLQHEQSRLAPPAPESLEANDALVVAELIRRFQRPAPAIASSPGGAGEADSAAPGSSPAGGGGSAG